MAARRGEKPPSAVIFFFSQFSFASRTTEGLFVVYKVCEERTSILVNMHETYIK